MHIVSHYTAFFLTAYKGEERIIKNIGHRNVKPTKPEKKTSICIYYKKRKEKKTS